MKARRPRRFLLALLVFGVILPVVGIVAARGVGPWLVVTDPLVRSDAIFVLDGMTPLRELEAVALFREGWAPRVGVALARSPIPEEARLLAGDPTPQERSSRVLLRAGVPDGAIIRLDRRVDNTLQELQVDFDYARAHGLRRIIIVSSPYHTRRIRLIWRTRFEHEVAAVVRATRYEPVAPARWWRSRRALEDVTHEIAGIANFLLGSPLPTFDSGR